MDVKFRQLDRNSSSLKPGAGMSLMQLVSNFDLVGSGWRKQQQDWTAYSVNTL